MHFLPEMFMAYNFNSYKIANGKTVWNFVETIYQLSYKHWTVKTRKKQIIFPFTPMPFLKTTMNVLLLWNCDQIECIYSSGVV